MGLMDLGSSIIGLGGEYFANQSEREAARSQANAQRAALAQGGKELTSGYTDISSLYDPYRQAGQQALGDYQSQDFSYVPDDFQYNQNVSDFLDPSMAYQQEQAMNQIQGNAAASGTLGSGAALKEMQSRGQQIAQQGYGDAFNRMQQDKGFQYGDFLNRANFRRQALQDRSAQLGNLINTGFGATSQQAGHRGQQAQGMSGLAVQQGNVPTSGYISGMSNAGLTRTFTDPETTGDIMNSISGLFGG